MRYANPDEKERADRHAFAAERDKLYHIEQEHFIRNIHIALMVVAGVAGAGAITSLIANSPTWLGILVVLSVVSGVLDNVCGLSAKIALHKQLSSDFSNLKRKFEKFVEGDSSMPLSILEDERERIEATEPPTMKWLNLRCHNDVAVAGGYLESDLYQIPFWARFVENWSNIGFSASKVNVPAPLPGPAASS